MRKVIVFCKENDDIVVSKEKCLAKILNQMRYKDLVINLTDNKDVKKSIAILEKKEA